MYTNWKVTHFRGACQGTSVPQISWSVFLSTGQNWEKRHRVGFSSFTVSFSPVLLADSTPVASPVAVQVPQADARPERSRGGDSGLGRVTGDKPVGNGRQQPERGPVGPALQGRPR